MYVERRCIITLILIQQPRCDDTDYKLVDSPLYDDWCDQSLSPLILISSSLLGKPKVEDQ
jgi:hypothetical protein